MYNSTQWTAAHLAFAWWQNSMEKIIHYRLFVQEHLLQNPESQCLASAMLPKALVFVPGVTASPGNSSAMRFRFPVLYIGTRGTLWLYTKLRKNVLPPCPLGGRDGEGGQKRRAQSSYTGSFVNS
jgi:hypothetical protein